MKLVNVLCGWWTVFVFIFLYLPIVLLIVYSFNKSKLNIEWGGFTTEWYGKVFEPDYDDEGNATDNKIVTALKNSLKIAGYTTVISVVLGTLSAWLLYRYRYRFKRLWETLLFIPIAIPEIIMGVSLMLLFTLAKPEINNCLDWMLGTPPEGPRFVLGFITTIIAHITFCFPFVLIAVQARLADVDPSLEEAAMDLGATPPQAFWKVIVPYLMPAIVSGALMSFTLSMDEALIMYFVNGPSAKTLQLEIWDHVRQGVNPMLNAISAIFIVATAVAVVLAESIRKLNR